jgi:hypothetical protein
MTAQPIQYDVFWGYGRTSIDGWIANPDRVRNAMNALAASLEPDRNPLFAKAVYQTSSGKVRSARRSRFIPSTSLDKAFAAVHEQDEQCGIFLFDESFTPCQLPEVLVHFHVQRQGASDLRVLRLPDGSVAHSFLICGVSVVLSRNFSFERLATRVCAELGLEFAYLFRGVGYNYDGETPLEWAYRNHAAGLRSGRLEDLGSLSHGVRLAIGGHPAPDA